MRIRIGRFAAITWVALAAGGPAAAGTMSLAWDPVEGAAGYRIYYGTSSGQYDSSLDVGATTSSAISGLEDCTTYYAAVKAYSSLGESVEFSNEITGWARPSFVAATTTAIQGNQIVVEIQGSNFSSDSNLLIDTDALPLDGQGNPLVLFDSIDVIACDRIQALVTIEPTAGGFQPAPIGSLPVALELQHADGVFNTGSIQVDVQFNPDRADINRNHQRTIDRVDGDDLASFARAWASNVGDSSFEFDCDMDGDTDVDGDDLALLASLFGQCRSGSGWSMGACS